MNPEDCIVLVPVKGPIEPKTQDALGALVERGYPVQLLRDGSQIDLARSWLASCALRKDYKETLWIDADVVFDPDDVEKLRGRDLPFVAGLYVRKAGDHSFACKFLPTTGGITLGQLGGPMEICWAGMGFTLIRREVYEAIGKTLPVCGGGYEGREVTPYFIPMLYPDGDKFTYLSEDYSFCERAKQAGFKIMADTSIKLGHVGSKMYTWDDIGQGERRGVSPPVQNQESEPMASEAELYAKIGRLQCLLEEKTTHYQAACQIVADVITGKLAPHCVMVNFTDWTISVSNDGQGVAMPGTINGLPRCVVGVAPQESAARNQESENHE